MLIKINEININPGRREASEESIEELVRSISEIGLLNPITIDQEHTLIAGLHRLEAAKRLMLLYSGKGRTVAEALGRVTDYVENPEKTNGGDLVTAYQCNPSITDQEFLFSKRQYTIMTGRDQGCSDVIAYHLRQSFKPGEITPELANKIGYDLAMSLTKGKHS